MKIILKKTLGLFLLLGLFSAPSHALKVGVLGGLGSTTFSMTPNSGSTFESQQAFGFGGSLEVDVAPFFGLEVDAIYMPRKWKQNSSAGNYELMYSNMVIPVLLRFNGLPFISVGAGAYYSFAMGDLEAKQGTTITTSNLSSNGIKKTGFGLIGAVGVMFDVAPMVGLGVDLRYLASISDAASNSGFDASYKEVHLLLAAQFHI